MLTSHFGDRYGRDPVKRIWLTNNLWWLKQILQIVMLNMCGQIAVYVLVLGHYIENLPCPLDTKDLMENRGIFVFEKDGKEFGGECGGIGGYFHFLALFPPIAIMGVLLPLTMAVYVEFEAYAVPREDILDNVLTDVDELESHKQYVRDKLTRRREEATSPSSPKADSFFNKLYFYESNFPLQNTPCHRYLAAMLDIARGTAETYIDERECFFVGMLHAAKVPCSRERLEHLVPWVREEMADDRPTGVASQLMFAPPSNTSPPVRPLRADLHHPFPPPVPQSVVCSRFSIWTLPPQSTRTAQACRPSRSPRALRR